MAKVVHRFDAKGVLMGYAIFCPACGHGHIFNIARDGYSGPDWEFNGNFEKPTFKPSMLVFVTLDNGKRKTLCHSFVTNGRIQFLDDCAHAMKGQTVDLAPFPGDYKVPSPDDEA